jgi:lipopolysaccharide transport system ATP-binding protein
VLAVGDAAFQQKCLGKIGEVSRSGRTVLFVSHNAAAIESLCSRGVVLERGRLVFDGSQSDALDFYTASRSVPTTALSHRTDRAGSGEVRIEALEMRNGEGEPVSVTRSGEDLEIALHFQRYSTRTFPRLAVQISVSTHLGAPVFTQANWHTGAMFGDLPMRGIFICRIPRLPLPPGHFHVGFRVSAEMRGRRDSLDEMEIAGDLPIEAGDFFGTGRLPKAQDGVCLVNGTWRLESSATSETSPALASCGQAAPKQRSDD